MASDPSADAQLVAGGGYESPHAPPPATSPLIRHSLGPLIAATGRPTVVITPRHSVTKEIALTEIGSVLVPFHDESVPVEVLLHGNYVFLQPADPVFFAGRRHPYDLPEADLLR